MTNLEHTFRRNRPAEHLEQLDDAGKLRQFERLMGRLQPKRHVLGVAGAQLERKLDKIGVASFNTDATTAVLEQTGLPEGAKQHLARMMEWYQQTAEQRKTQEEMLRATLKFDNPTQFGQYTYELMMHLAGESDIVPKGKVYGLSHPLAFMLLIKNSDDYNRLSHWKERSGGEYIHRSNLGGANVEWHGTKIGRIPVALARYHDRKLPNARELRRLAGTNEIVAHELAHALQHSALDKFESIEDTFTPYVAQEDLPHLTAHRAIKDEVLAHIKGCSANVDVVADPNDTYNYLFEQLPVPAQERARELVWEISAKLRSFDHLLTFDYRLQKLPRMQARRILYYQLLDVPLSLLPAQLAVINRYYDELGTITDLPNSIGEQFPSDAYFGTLQSHYAELASASHPYNASRAAVGADLFTTPRSVSPTELRGLHASATAAQRELRFATVQNVPAYASEIKFLPAQSNHSEGQVALDLLMTAAQDIYLGTLNGEVRRLERGEDVVGAPPKEEYLLSSLQAALEPKGYLLDQAAIDECNIDRGTFSLRIRITIPATNQSVKARLHFTSSIYIL